jgi:hypothetical protein
MATRHVAFDTAGPTSQGTTAQLTFVNGGTPAVTLLRFAVPCEFSTVRANSASDGGDITLSAGHATTATSEGGDITILAGNGNTTGTGGDITITGGAGGATNAAGGDVVLVGGGGGGTTGTGGHIDLAPGNAAGSGVDGEVRAGQVAADRAFGMVFVTHYMTGAHAPTAAEYPQAPVIFIAPRPMRIKRIQHRNEVLAGAALTAQVQKVSSGTAVLTGEAAGRVFVIDGAGTIDLNASANTTIPSTLDTTAANLDLIAGDAIALFYSAELQSVNGGIVSSTLTISFALL